ncbi:MAG: hypothetical protein R3F61_05375 [Myxococcota bacterium]
MAKASRAAQALARSLREVLRRASDEGRIDNSIDDVLKWVQTARQGVDEVIEIPRGSRNFVRSREAPHFRRDDGAWFDFAITLRNGQIVAWSFELRFPDDWPDGPGWIRFDLNHPGHANDDRGLRCHIHLGSDDDGMSIPYEQRTPAEVLHLLIHDLRKTGRERGSPVITPA